MHLPTINNTPKKSFVLDGISISRCVKPMIYDPRCDNNLQSFFKIPFVKRVMELTEPVKYVDNERKKSRVEISPP